MVHQTARRVLALCALLLNVCAAAQAQPWEDKLYLNANLGFALSSRSFSETQTPVIYDEHASVTTTHNIDGGMMPIDVAGGARIWRGLGVGGAFTWRSTTETATVDARVPHPTLFGQPRFVSVDTPLNHSEWALHLDALYVVPISPRLDLSVFGGPSFVSVTQDLVTSIQIGESSPTFATVEIAKIGTVTETERALGFSVGGDATYFLTRLIGVGATVRYVSAAVDFPVAGGGSARYDAGGLQIAFGARIRMR